jgi:hypothetical protein
MGHTILAHILFATQQIDFELDSFFSESGDAHQIDKLNNTLLTAHHLIESPNRAYECVLQIVSVDWFDILKTKMSYDKWFKSFPNLENYSDFFVLNTQLQKDKLWQEYYNQVKDIDWPECELYDKVINLPLHIRTEILNNYIDPIFNIIDDATLFEFLAISYYDKLIKFQIFVYKNHSFFKKNL